MRMSLFLVSATLAISIATDGNATTIANASVNNYSVYSQQSIPRIQSPPYEAPLGGSAEVVISQQGYNSGTYTGIGVHADANMVGPTPKYAVGSSSYAAGFIYDRLNFGAVPITGAHIRFTFTLDGALRLTSGVYESNASLSAGLTVTTGAHSANHAGSTTYDFQFSQFAGYNQSVHYNLPDTYPASERRIEYTDEATGFAGGGLIIADVPIVPAMATNGYIDVEFQLSASAGVYDQDLPPGGYTHLQGGQYISAEADALHTLKFTSLTIGLEDGSEVTPQSLGLQFAFDSGMPIPFTPTPESSTLVLATLGGLALLAIARRSATR